MKYEGLQEKSKSIKGFDDKEIQIGLQQIQGNGHRYKLDDISSRTGRIQCYVY